MNRNVAWSPYCGSGRGSSCRNAPAAVMHLFLAVLLFLCLNSFLAAEQPPLPPPIAPTNPVLFGGKEFVPGAPWLDDHGVPINAHGGGLLTYGGKTYWFGEHKIEGPAGNCAHVGVHCYSSTDLYSWHDEGIVLPVSSDPTSDLQKGCVIERPKVIYNAKTKQFVMWFHYERKGTGYLLARSGVAVSDSVTGPYYFLYSLRPNAGVWPEGFPESERRPWTPEDQAALEAMRRDSAAMQALKTDQHANRAYHDSLVRRDFVGGQVARDMTLYVDDDGTAYHIYASEENGTLQLSQLTDDYLRPAGKYWRLLEGQSNEAPTICKRNGKYWLITSGLNGWSPCAARLAVADRITGPWTPLPNPCVGKDAGSTFRSQGTYLMPVPDRPGSFIFLADRWTSGNAIDGRYIWLPVQWQPSGQPFLEWKDRWDLGFFDRPATP